MKKRVWVLAGVGGVLFLGCVTPVGFFVALVLNNRGQWTADKVRESEQAAVPLIAAITQYKRDTGAHPDELEQLVPAYLASIPTPSAGAKEFHYLRWENDRYFLYIPRDNDRWSSAFLIVGESYEYDRESDSWFFAD